MERLRSPAIQPDGQHMLTVMRYGDLNPVRAGIVASANEWKYSSYKYYAYGQANPLIDPAPDYLALGRDFISRRKAYVGFFAKKLIQPLLERRADLVGAWFIGNSGWVEQRLCALGLRTLPAG